MDHGTLAYRGHPQGYRRPAPSPFARGTLITHNKAVPRWQKWGQPQPGAARFRGNARLNGRETPIYCIQSALAYQFWQASAETQRTANGRRIHRPFDLPFIWIAPAGTRNLTITLRHRSAPQNLPQIVIFPSLDATHPTTILTAPTAKDTTHVIQFSTTAVILTNIRVHLRHRDNEPGAYTDWTTIATS